MLQLAQAVLGLGLAGASLSLAAHALAWPGARLSVRLIFLLPALVFGLTGLATAFYRLDDAGEAPPFWLAVPGRGFVINPAHPRGRALYRLMLLGALLWLGALLQARYHWLPAGWDGLPGAR